MGSKGLPGGGWMVKIIFGWENCDHSKFVLDSRAYFRKHKKPEWFEDDFVKEFLKPVNGAPLFFLRRH